MAHDSRHGAEVVPEPRHILPLLIGLAVIFLAIAVAVGTQLVRGVDGPDDGATPTPSVSPAQPGSEPVVPATATAPPAGTTPPPATADAEPDAPELLPAEFAGFRAIGDPNQYVTSYRSDQDFLMVEYWPMGTIADAGLEGASTVGQWSCGTDAGKRSPACVRAINGGYIVISGIDEAPLLASVGDQLIAAWK